MSVVSTLPRKKSWQTNAERRSFEAQMAVTRDRVMARLRELRQIHGSDERPLSQEDAAHRAGITTRQWQRWESGESMPYSRNLGKVAENFGVTVDWFETAPAQPTETPDLMGQINGKHRPDDLRELIEATLSTQEEILTRLQRVEAQIVGLVEAIGHLAQVQPTPPALPELDDQDQAASAERRAAHG
jgi:transcriptional regulator with XRE-family HTH domain